MLLRFIEERRGHIINLAILVILCTAQWPINKYAGKRQARAEIRGLIQSIVGAIVALFMCYSQEGGIILDVKLFSVSAMFGIAYSVGFCICILRCLDIGPVGLTMLINGFGLTGAIIVGLFYAELDSKDYYIIAFAIILIIASGAIVNFSKKEDKKVSKKWFAFVMVGGLLSVVSFAASALAGKIYPLNANSYNLFGFAIAALILLIYNFFKQNKTSPLNPKQTAENPSDKSAAIVSSKKITKVEVISASAIGIVNIFVYKYLFTSMQSFSPLIVFPLISVIPTIIMSIAGIFAYDEKPSMLDWISMFIGIAGIIILTKYQ